VNAAEILSNGNVQENGSVSPWRRGRKGLRGAKNELQRARTVM